MKPGKMMSKKFVTKLQDKGLFDSNNFGANYLGLSEKKDPSYVDKNQDKYKSAMRVMGKKKPVGMDHGSGKSAAFPKANTFK